MGQMLKKGVFVATTAAGDYLQFFERAHAVQAVVQFAERKGISGCRWTAEGHFMTPNGRRMGTVGALEGTIKGSQGLYHCDYDVTQLPNPQVKEYPLWHRLDARH